MEEYKWSSAAPVNESQSAIAISLAVKSTKSKNNGIFLGGNGVFLDTENFFENVQNSLFKSDLVKCLMLRNRRGFATLLSA